MTDRAARKKCTSIFGQKSDRLFSEESDMHTLFQRSLVLAFLIALLLVAQAAHAATVPDFTLPLLDGKSVTLNEFRGKPVLVNFFHSK
jgi:maltodextrin utilization protein YvdJ